MTTGAEQVRRKTWAYRRRRTGGQSIVEFALLVPLIVGMLQLLIQVQNAISTAIVNQKYARSTLHFLAFNHRYYPERRFSKNGGEGGYFGGWWVGVDDNMGTGRGDIVPHAPERKIGLRPGDDEGQAEFPTVAARQKVRIRITSFICVPPMGPKDGGFFTEGSIGDQTFAGGFRYCAD